MSDILNIGASGVRAYQSALGVISENIANAGTAGYVRRDARLVESSGAAATIPGQLERRVLGGVHVGEIARQWDQFRANDVRTAGADVARSEAGISWLERVEGALAANGLGTHLTGFFNAGTALAADPTASARRTDFLAKADATATAFRGTAQSLAALGSEVAAEARQSASTLNGLAQGLAGVNQSLTRAQPGTNAHAALLDQRDRVLDQMSTLVSLSVETSTTGTATVRLNQAGGPVLVSGTSAAALVADTNSSGAIAFTLHQGGEASAVALAGGALAGIADASARIAAAHAEVDTLATDFADGVNAVQAAGIDLDGGAGAPLFAFAAEDAAATLSVTAIPGRGIAAAAPFVSAVGNTNTGAGTAALAIDATATALPARAAYRFTITGGNVVITDPATAAVLGTAPYVAGGAIAGNGFRITLAGAPAEGDSFTVSATGPGSRDNGNLAGLTALRGTGGYEGRLDTLVTSNASALESRRTLAETQAAIRDNAIDARDAVSGVNLDSEAVELMQFQQAYQASSRLIQVAREMFQTLLDAA